MRLGECALESLSKPHSSLLQTKPKPAPGQGDGITKAETSEQHWVRSSSPKEKTAAGFKVPGWCSGGSGAPVGSCPNLWCPRNYKNLAPGKVVGMASADGVPRFFPQVAPAPITAQLAELAAAHAASLQDKALSFPRIRVSSPHEVPSMQCKCKGCLLTRQSGV